MNERIKEIHRQVMLWSDTPDCPDTVEWHPGQIPEEYTKKFAELLIRECVLHLHRRGVEGFGILEERNLKEHFGVDDD